MNGLHHSLRQSHVDLEDCVGPILPLVGFASRNWNWEPPREMNNGKEDLKRSLMRTADQYISVAV